MLECLKIFVASDDKKVFRLHSRSLKRLTFERVSSFVFDSAGVVIDAPRLCFLSINDNISKSIIIHNMESAVLQMSLVGFVRLLEIDDEFFDDIYEEGVSLRRSNIHKFLHGISMAKSMKISRGTFKVYTTCKMLVWYMCIFYHEIFSPTFCFHFGSSLCVTTRNSNRFLSLVTCPTWISPFVYTILNGYQPFLRASQT